MAEMTLEGIEERQRAILRLLDRLEIESDPHRAQALTNQLAREGAILDEEAKAFEHQEQLRAGPPPSGRTEVLLTPEQRARVRERTGVDLEVVSIADETGTVTRSMPHSNPARIEWLAIKEAMQQRAAAESQGKMRLTVERALAELAQQGGRGAQELASRLNADPQWRKILRPGE